MCKNLAPKNLKIIKNCAKIRKINFFRPKLCIKSGFCNEPKIVKISHCAQCPKMRNFDALGKFGLKMDKCGLKMGKFGQKWADLDQK